MAELSKYELGRIEVLKYTIKITTQLETKWAAEAEIERILNKKYEK